MTKPKLRSRVLIKKPKIIYKDLKQKGLCGLAYSYLDGDEHKAEISNKLSDSETCKTLYHELTHLSLPDLKEPKVIRMEKLYGEAIWRMVLRLKRKWKKEWDKKRHNT